MRQFCQVVNVMEIATIILPHYSIICSFTKNACKFAINRGPNIFLEVLKRIECLQQNTLFKLCFSDSDSEQVQSFLLKLKTATTCFEWHIFHNNLKDNIRDSSIRTNIVGCYQNENPSQTFFTSKKFSKFFLVGVTFKAGL